MEEERALLLVVVGMKLWIWIGREGAAFMGTVGLRGSGVRSVGGSVPPIRTQASRPTWARSVEGSVRPIRTREFIHRFFFVSRSNDVSGARETKFGSWEAGEEAFLL
jgi:hypothetical protein